GARKAIALGLAGGLALGGSGCKAGLIGATAVALSGGGGGSPEKIPESDLVASSLTVPPTASIESGKVVFDGGGTAASPDGEIMFTVLNQGPDDGSAFNAAVYLSRTKTITTASYRVRQITVDEKLTSDGRT